MQVLFSPRSYYRELKSAQVINTKGYSIPGGNTTDAANTGQSEQIVEQIYNAGIDPALQHADQIAQCLNRLHDMLQNKIGDTPQNSKYDLAECLQQLKDLKRSLKHFKSKHTGIAHAILQDAIQINTLVIKDCKNIKARELPEWKNKVLRWERAVSALLPRATKLRSIAAAQPGQGCGNRTLPTDGTGSQVALSTTQVLKARYEKLHIMEANMKDAQASLGDTKEKQLEAQAKVAEFAIAMHKLQAKTTTMGETRAILVKAIDAMTGMQLHIQKLAGFFETLAQIISIGGVKEAQKLVKTIKAGKTIGSNGVELGFYQQDIAMIRGTLLTLRGHFGFVIQSADLYLTIATKHIDPCLRMAALMPLSSSEPQQEAAKIELLRATQDSADAIQLLAQTEADSYHKKMEVRCKELRAEIEKLPALPRFDHQLATLHAIEDGVREASDETMSKVSEKYEMEMEIMEDL